MNYMEYFPIDFLNGEGVRASLFVAGCTHRCRGCFSLASHDFEAGHRYTKALEDAIICDLLDTKVVRQGLSLLGGDPLHPKNLEGVNALIDRVKECCPTKDIWLWSGYVYEGLSLGQLEVVNKLDVLIDGPFIEGLKDPSLQWRGSSNQRVLRLAKKG